jgi:hypothetical protein
MWNLFKKKRILEYNGLFIPQFRDGIFYSWFSIDKEDGLKYYTLSWQIEFCSHDNLEDAKKFVLSQTTKIHNV